ncbi:translation initiation factor IF-2, chloroplastic-like [Iris pallida]|uniref:Translation initiation factor IF-2, chloroplastic n=1 Tax=Iris pallida TaxID=29817 RepID=A0AAX6FVI9_IRIPA|nr:translation initiation factor IF-2, chloroplastic-like [Iris pallida]
MMVMMISMAPLGAGTSARPNPPPSTSDAPSPSTLFLAHHHHHHHHHHHSRSWNKNNNIFVSRITTTTITSNRHTSRLRHWISHSSPPPTTSTGGLCRCMAATDLTQEKRTSSSLESTFKEGGGGKDANAPAGADLVLKPSPMLLLKARPSAPVAVDQLIAPVDKRNLAGSRDRDQVIESLGEVLDKAEKLETSAPRRLDTRQDIWEKGARANGSPMQSRPANAAATQKPKTLKSVWRKGNPVANVQRVVKEVPKVQKGKEEEEESKNKATTYSATGAKKLDAPLPAPSRPRVPSPPKPTPSLHAKPSAAPPSPPQSVAKKPIPAKDRKPILIDKFQVKKQFVNPAAAAAEAVLAPTKPVKGGPPPSKAKDERRRKMSVIGGLRKRLADDAEIPDASELDVPIQGVATARKGRKWSKASRKAARLQAAKAAEPVKVEILEVGEEGMLSEELAYHLAIDESDILGYLFTKGVRPDAVQTLDKDMVKMICMEYGVEVIEVEPAKVEEMARKKEVLDDEDLDMLEDRPPVITIMGHVDHGKTTLLDYIRKSKVVASEAGGITQGIGAYKVLVPVDKKLHPCVFLDTPGHEAFGAMRARGARVTDIVIIVVAADDGVRPQTSEAIAHAKAAGVPIIIAINKIDKEGTNPDRVMQELSSVGLMPEIWGGDIPMVQISALKGKNVDELLETVMLVAELQELKANPHRNAKGSVIEAGLDKSRGPVATLIVQNGTLRKGDVVVCGKSFGKMRALFGDREGRLDEAGPSIAVQVIGLSDVPVAGDEFEVVDSLDVARQRAESCATSLRDARISAKAGEGMVTLSSIASAVSAGKQSGLDRHQLNIILKVDLQGSIEAIRHALQILPQENVTLKFLLQAPGDVSTSDVDLAVAAEAIIFGFNVKAPSSVKSYADKKSVEIRLYRIIYELIDDMRNAMEGLLEPVEEQISIGSAGVRATFSSGSGRVAGCMVTEGKVVKECGVRVVRNGKTIHTGIIDSLRRVKEEVKEVGAGLECGIGVDGFMDWEAGDVIEAFNAVKKQRTLEEASATVTAALTRAGVGV